MDIPRWLSIYTDDPLPIMKRVPVAGIDVDFAELSAKQWAIAENLDGKEGRVFVRYSVIGFKDRSVLPTVLRSGLVTS